MADIIIVGAGLFGSVAAALARKTGHRVTVIDASLPLAASKCSGNLFKESWLQNLTNQERDTAIKTLSSLYSMRQLLCQQPNGKVAELTWVPQDQVLSQTIDSDLPVTAVGNGWVELDGAYTLRGKVLVAAGVCCATLLNIPMKSLVGCSLRIPGKLRQPMLNLYAPYKHAIAYQVEKNTIWCGDGAAILEKRWKGDVRSTALRRRAEDLFQLDTRRAELRTGARPSVPGYPGGYFKRVFPKTWVSTGGAKNGLVLAALQAYKFMEVL